MPKYKIEAPDIELRCILCPKTPTFSDISHLLTHIASKSHLACKFKLQVESRNQQHAKDKLEDFEFWYNANNLDEMLGDRLAAKEDKRKKKKPTKSGGTAIKREPRTGDNDYDNNLFQAPRANMHPFPDRSGASRSTPAPQWDQSVYSTPTTRSKVPHFSIGESPDRNYVDPMLTSTPWKLDPEDEDEEKLPGEKITDSAKLKGIQWPGMAVFDAATPEGKRMRNQRKNSKVLRDMIATSEGVEPAEISYHSNGEFRASRDIFGPLSTENSPVQPKRPSPKKRNVRKARKATFNELSTNGPRLRATRGRPPKAAGMGRGRERERERESHKNIAASNHYRPNVFTQPPPTLNPLASFTGGYKNLRYMASVDEEEEYRLTAGDLGKKKSAFSIFEDEISPIGTESPLEETPFDFSSHGSSIYPDNPTASARMPPSPTPTAKPASRSMGGMNGGNGGYGLGGMQGQENHFHSRRSLSDTTVFAPHTFHQNNFNPLSMFDNHGNHGYTRPYAYGTQASYLFGGNQTSSYMENNMNGPSGYGSNFMGDFRQINPMANASLTGNSSGAFQAHSLASMADIGTAANNENALGLQFNL